MAEAVLGEKDRDAAGPSTMLNGIVRRARAPPIPAGATLDETPGGRSRGEQDDEDHRLGGDEDEDPPPRQAVRTAARARGPAVDAAVMEGPPSVRQVHAAQRYDRHDADPDGAATVALDEQPDEQHRDPQRGDQRQDRRRGISSWSSGRVSMPLVTGVVRSSAPVDDRGALLVRRRA